MANTHATPVFEDADIQYILNLPEVRQASAQLESQSRGMIYFTIEVTPSIKAAVLSRLGLDLSAHTTLPMRWVKGDTAPHIDVGKHTFSNTYLMYLNDSPGELLIGNASYPIVANSGFIFNEGTYHETRNTGANSRLLLGPMSELAEPVGSPMFYYNSEFDAINNTYTNYIAYAGNFTVGNVAFGSIGTITSWRLASNSTGSSSQSVVYSNGNSLAPDGSYFLYPAAPCFLEGSKILALVGNTDIYVPVESLRAGDLVKTSRDGYKKVELIGKGVLANPGGTELSENRLYKCPSANYPELTEDLVITGDHSILVDQLTEDQRTETTQRLGKIFVTDKKYRLTAQIDNRTEPWGENKTYTIWHFALENEDDGMNYGVYANGGLLVETCSLRFLEHKSNMTLL